MNLNLLFQTLLLNVSVRQEVVCPNGTNLTKKKNSDSPEGKSDGLLPVFTRTILVRLPIERINQPGEEASFAFRSGTVTALTTSQSGIEQIAHGIAKHVEGIDGNRQAKPWPERQPGGLLHV